MQCKVCNTKMTCKNSRESDGIRWRQYYCPKCASLGYTKETSVSANLCKERIRDISTYDKKRTSYRKGSF